jgi:iron complex outermembrane receptor protein
MARALNANVALRRTEYSLSGGVTTWKAGLDYQMIDDLRFRGTVSRDIRAPNLLELFNSATQNSNNQLYPSSSNGVTTPALVIASGNPALKPERALTKTYGVIATPTFLPGLSLSADYYNIKIDGAIGTVSAQQTLDNCFAGLTQFCSQFSFANGTVKVFTSNLNLNVLQNAGFDFEASYRTQLFDNPLSLHVLANHQTKNFSQAPNGPVLSTLGADTAPRWRVTAQAQYSIEGFNFFLQERYIAPSLMDATKVEGVYTNNNHIPAVYYTDLTVSYKLDALGSSNELYLTVNNLFDRDPPTDVSPPTSFAQPTNRAVYDGIGQYFNFGIRFKF